MTQSTGRSFPFPSLLLRLSPSSTCATPRPPPRFEVKAPAGAPNVLIVLIDDMGFGQSSAFGGPIHMPTVERLANERAALQPVPHHRALLADPRGAAHAAAIITCATWDRSPRRPPPFPANRAASQQRGAAGRDAAAQRLRHRRLRQDRTRPPPGRSAPPARPTAGRPVPASTSSTASSAARPTSGRRLLYDGMTQVEPPHDPNYHFMTDMTEPGDQLDAVP